MDENENSLPESENDGGEGGGEALILKRSELAILRRYANRWPIQEAERAEVVETVMRTMRQKNAGPRARLMSVQTLAALDRINVAEMATYVAAKKAIPGELQPAQVTIIGQQTNQINIGVQEDESWYGSPKAHALASQASSPSSTDPIGPEPVQGSGLRPAVGKNGNGAAYGDEGPRAE